MALNRKQAKDAIKEKQPDDPELDAAIGEAQRLQLDLVKENNRHREKMAGWLGIVFGGEASAPFHIALVFAVVCLLGFGFCLYMASKGAAQAEFWAKQAERALAAASAALAYIFGRGKK